MSSLHLLPLSNHPLLSLLRLVSRRKMPSRNLNARFPWRNLNVRFPQRIAQRSPVSVNQVPLPTVNVRRPKRRHLYLGRRKGRGRGRQVPQRAAKGRRPLEEAGKALAAARNEVSLPSWLMALTEQPLLPRTRLFHHYHSLGCRLHMFSAFSMFFATLAVRIWTWSIFLVPS